MQNTEFNTREYFDKIYSRPVILEAKATDPKIQSWQNRAYGFKCTRFENS